MKLLTYSVLLTALIIAACGAYFSIIGLTLLFVGGGVSIIVMGTALEIGKLVAATFLKQKWNDISVWMRTYLLVATLVLMGINSIGIYGYLSAGYTATSLSVQGYERQIEINAVKIKDIDKEIMDLRQDTYNQNEIVDINENRKKFTDQRLQLISQRNQQIEKLRSSENSNKDASGDIASAKQALDVSKASLDSDSVKELEQIKMYNSRLEILDQEVKRWMDEGSGNLFKKNGMDKARETKDLQKKERDTIDSQIKSSQDRIEKLRIQYNDQVKEYNDRVASIELRAKAQRAELDGNIKLLEKENSDVVAAISAYNKECDDKISNLNGKKNEMVEQNKNKILKNQDTIQQLHAQSDQIKEKIVHTDVGTFKFIAKSLNIPLDSAVNYFILMIMSVFDPLAVVLVLAYNIMIHKDKKETGTTLPPTLDDKEKKSEYITTTTTNLPVSHIEESVVTSAPEESEVVVTTVEPNTTESTTAADLIETIEETTTTIQPDPYSEKLKRRAPLPPSQVQMRDYEHFSRPS
jgi:hypothetical protein